MEAVVVESIQFALETLLTLSKEQISLVRNFKRDLERLKDSFRTVGSVLHDAETREVSDEAVKRWLRKLQDLAFEADNVFDEISYRSLQPNKLEIKKCLQSFIFSCCISHRLNLGCRIKDIDEKLKLINKEANDFGFRPSATIRASPTLGAGGMETDSYSLDPNIIGRENNVLTIVEMLISTERLLSVLPIVGMGGLGKTTLARLVFRDQQIISHFGGDNRVWVHVPREFDAVVLLKKIITSMNPTANVENNNREALLKMLQNNLGAKRYLLVLDDVWNEERRLWDDFADSLSGISSAMGNCLIVTTRRQKVASIVGTLPSHELQGLPEDDCWSIIKAKAFGEGNIIPIEFEALGKPIAIRCQGLPLAAKVVGGILCGKSKDEWLLIEKTRLSNFGDGDGDSINKILKLSFDNLSLPSLKKCFAYCSMFPKGDTIEKEQLIQLWMAEGFLQTNQNSNNMETTGGKFFNHLLQNSLLQVAERHITYGYVTHCNMHDLVHDLACDILEDESNNNGCQSRYIGYNSSGRVGSLSITKEHTRCLRTLFFNGKVGDIMFSDFKSLHSLTLMGYDILDLPSSIGNLIHLRYLDISETMVKCLPDSVGELYHLQTLRAETGSLEKLPDSLKYCVSLIHLHIDDETMLPSEIGRLTYLQTLTYYCVRKEKGFGISELRSLNNLRGRLEIHNLENVLDKREAESADLFRKSDIYEIMFKWNEGDREGEENDESVLQGLEPHSNIKRLEICGFRGRSLPPWTSKLRVQDEERLDNLIEIKLEECSEVEELPMLGHLPHLKSLYLSDLENVKSIGSSFYNIDNCSSIRSNISNTIVVFPALERLELSGMSNLREWAQVEMIPESEVVVFPRLEYLKLRRCRQVEELPMLGHLPLLKSLYLSDLENVRSIGSSFYNIDNCSSSSSSSISNTIVVFPALEKLELSGMSNLREWAQVEMIPESEVVVFPRLEYLKLRRCRQVEELPMLGHLLHLKSLYLSYLENVRSIGSSFYNIDNCSSSNISNTIVVFPALERLELSGMSNLREWAQVEIIPAPVVFPRLKYMKVEGCTQLMSSPRHFPCLKKLYIYDMDSGVPLENILLCGSNNKLGSLTHLEIRGIKGLECLPDGVFANNHNLLRLSILDCLNLRGLPDGLHTLSSLEELRIVECPNLKSIAAAAYPPKRDSNNIDESQNKKCFFSTSLRRLEINNCKGLIHLPIEMVESCAPSLERLILHGLNSLTNIPMVIGCLHKMPRLRELRITEVPKFNGIEIGPLSSSSSSSLRYLEMGGWRSDDNNVSSSSCFNEVVDAILQTSRVSLRVLLLRGMSHWDCLPDQIQHLTSLSRLWLDDYGMEALPEWFGNLQSLRELVLSNCTELRHLPSKKAMQQRLLTKLTELHIIECPLLLKERHEDDPQIVDSEWHKIFHIPRIEVNWHVISCPLNKSIFLH